jgi:hypothetical protein
MSEASVFIGKEAEGPNKGLITLFISDPDINFGELVEILGHYRNHRIEQLYFGAGNNRKVPNDPQILNAFIGWSKRYIITLEIGLLSEIDKIPSYIKKFVRIVYCVIDLSIDHSDPIYITDFKIIGEKRLCWYTLQNYYLTKLSHPYYESDKVIKK